MIVQKTAGKAMAVLLLLISILVTSSAIPAYSQSEADEGQGDPTESALSVSPAIVDNALDPGTEFELPLSLTNLTEGPLAVRSISREAREGAPSDSDSDAFDASSWFEFDQADFILLGGETRRVVVSVSVPDNAEPGGHYATLNFESFQAGTATAGATSVSARVSVVVLLTVLGDITENVELVGPIRTEDVQTEVFPTQFDFTLRNTGNIHVQPRGELVVTNMFGRESARLPLNVPGEQQAGVLLPGASRAYSVDWEHGVKGGLFNVRAELIVGPSQTEINSERTQFFLLPFIVVLPALLLILLTVLVLLLMRRRRSKRIPVATGGNHMADENDENRYGATKVTPDE